MDYSKIYADFIADRRARGAPVGYTENHHIVPRLYGGGNSKSNLIRLSARDHYFAHCCLARIHGGGMWKALHLMGQTQKTQHGAEGFSRGHMVEVARREASKARSEHMKLAWMLGDVKGRKVYGPISEHHRAAVAEAGRRPRATRAAEIARAVATRQKAAPVFRFVDTRTGEVFTGTALGFRQHSGIGQSHVSLLVGGKVVFAKGWALEGNQDKPQGNRDRTVRIFQHKDGRIYEGTAYDFNREHIRDSGMLSNCINGKNGVKSARGWRYVGEKANETAA